MAFSRRTPLRVYLFFEVFPIFGGRTTLMTSRNSNAVETRLVSTPFGSYCCIRLELDVDGLKMLVDSSTGSLVEPEWTSGSWTVVRSDCTWLHLIDSSPWYRGIVPSTGDTLIAGRCIISAKLRWPCGLRIRGSRALSDIFRGLIITCSFYFAQEHQEGNFTGVSSPGAKPDKVAICQRPLHAHERRKLNFFSGLKSTGR